MKYLYLVNSWIPFPTSEMGGVVAVVAESDAEAFDILSNDSEYPAQYINLIYENVVNAPRYGLVDEHPSGVELSFIT
jgi:hypothetical protein